MRFSILAAAVLSGGIACATPVSAGTATVRFALDLRNLAPEISRAVVYCYVTRRGEIYAHGTGPSLPVSAGTVATTYDVAVTRDGFDGGPGADAFWCRLVLDGRTRAGHSLVFWSTTGVRVAGWEGIVSSAGTPLGQAFLPAAPPQLLIAGPVSRAAASALAIAPAPAHADVPEECPCGCGRSPSDRPIECTKDAPGAVNLPLAALPRTSPYVTRRSVDADLGTKPKPPPAVITAPRVQFIGTGYVNLGPR